MMINVVDPYIIGYSSDRYNNDFEDYILRLIEIKSIIEDLDLKTLLSSNTSKILAEEYDFPAWDKIDELLNRSGLKGIYQPQDIIVSIESILKCANVEDFLEIHEILFDYIEISPSEITEKRSEIYLEELKRILMYLGLSEKLGYDAILATIDLESRNIIVTGEIIDIDTAKNDSTKYLGVYNDEIKTYSSIKNLYTQLNPIKIWKSAASKNEYSFALQVYLFQKERNIFDNEKKWRFGEVFFQEMNRYGFLHEDSKIESLLRSMSATILYKNLEKTHSLRTDAGANSPQSIRNDTAKAWRRDIDYEFHLHYWQYKTHVEFSRVVVHNDYKIIK